MPCPSRRGLIAAGLLGLVRPARAQSTAVQAGRPEPFRGRHQPGIASDAQTHTCFAAFDLTADRRDALIALLRAWTEAAERLMHGDPAGPQDGGASLGLGAARLTLTFGFGTGMFGRYGLEAQRPAAFVDLPKFNGDQLDPARSGGDLSVQACADDPQVAFHAIRELDRLAEGAARLRWMQTGFLPSTPAGETPRNLMGFRDGTNNPRPDGVRPDVPNTIAEVAWVGPEAPAWLRDGSYLVARRIRISLEHWDRTELDFQEEVIGRHKLSGAPIGREGEFDPLGLDRETEEGTPVIAENAHVRLAAPASNGGAQILRRAYSYNDGLRFTAERWPPWRQGMFYDAGLFFLAYQRDPATGFTRIFREMAKFDMLNQYTTHNASALFACPGGLAPGEFIGQKLFDA